MDTTAIRDAALRCRAVLMDGLHAAGAGTPNTEARQAAAMHLLRAAAARMLQTRGVVTGGLDQLLVFPLPCTPRCAGSLEVRRTLDTILDDPALTETWRPGNEEALGWLYQYFNEPDLDVFRGSRPPKVPAELLALKTQLFTPRWIVRFLVENTLGRLWLQMHPDSRLAARLECLVPLASFTAAGSSGLDATGGLSASAAAGKRPVGTDQDRFSVPEGSLRPVREIRVLDPACGAMHFGLVAFDLLADMYREEMERAGQPGWPERPSVEIESAIPAAILTNNLFGFDIDPLAVRLSSVTLFLKAASMNPQVRPVQGNLRCADVLQRPGESLWDEHKELDEAAVSALASTYDVVVTNPPYLDSRDYNTPLKAFIAAAYPAGKRNLYAAFLERSVEFLSPGGRLGIITPQTFMFISSFARLRDSLRNSVAIETLVQTGLNTFPDAVVDAAFYVLRREERADGRDNSTGKYFRLTRPPDPDAKRHAFERAVASLKAGRQDESVFLCRQGDFDHLPGRPWVYWITQRVRELFDRFPKFSEVAKPIVGLQTSDNFRFLRFWWEVYFRDTPHAPAESNHHIAFGCTDRASAVATGRKWFPHVKGGDFRRWYGNQEYVVNWADDGGEIRHLGIESGRVASRPQNMDYYFRPGVTWTHTSSRGLSVRILPPGFICNVEGMAAFQLNDRGSSLETLAIMNSSFAAHVIGLLNPTVHFGGREVGDLPYPQADPPAVKALESHVSRAIDLARQDSREDETTWEFVAPPYWRGGLKETGRRREELTEIERLIDDEVYALYKLGAEDRAAIEADLNGHGCDAAGYGCQESLCRDSHLDNTGAGFPSPDGVGRKDSPDEGFEKGFSRQQGGRIESRRGQRDLAFRWVSYAVGVVMGRFRPGVEGAVGCGRFDAHTASQLRSMALPDGIAELSEDGQDDFAVRVSAALQLMLSADDAREVVAAATTKDKRGVDALRAWLAGAFFRRHLQQYRGRPVYWLLQSPERCFSAYVHYERLNASTLRTLRSPRCPELSIAEARRRQHDDMLADLQAFDAAIDRALTTADERGKPVGWQLEPDDGVLINAAPLRELMPLWARELSACWKMLESGQYDWSFTARRYWPDRVQAACRTNKSYALTHGSMNASRSGASGGRRSSG